MLLVISEEQELKVLKSLAFFLKYSDKYLMPFEATDFLGMPMIMPQEEFLIRTLLDSYGITSYKEALDKIELLQKPKSGVSKDE